MARRKPTSNLSVEALKDQIEHLERAIGESERSRSVAMMRLRLGHLKDELRAREVEAA